MEHKNYKKSEVLRIALMFVCNPKLKSIKLTKTMWDKILFEFSSLSTELLAYRSIEKCKK